MTSSISLNGRWRLAASAPGAGDAQRWFETGVPDEQAIPAQVPGDVHLDLLRAGRISAPLYGKNALDCLWVEARDWWYSRIFQVDEGFLRGAELVELHAEGLDLTSAIWLNGECVGEHNNQFIGARFDVTDLIRPGENLLVIRLDVGLQAAPGDRRRYPHISSLPASGLPRMWMRKAQFSFGWDWAPRLLTCGIWRPISLRSYRHVALRNVLVTPSLKGESAQVSVKAEIECIEHASDGLTLSIDVEGHDVSPMNLDLNLLPGPNEVETIFRVPDPKLWWPHSLGAPHVYDLSLKVLQNDQILDRYDGAFGIREIELVTDPLPNGEGQSFTVVINDEPVFCKGANWVPADSIPARVSREKYRALVSAAADCNINMLRVWGGGIYEDPYFYELCDQTGIMVWQDFMFSCSLYPDDDANFRAEVEREAVAVVKQLYNHPCLTLWCGNNENDWIYSRKVKDGWEVPEFYGRRIYHEILPRVCDQLDPSRPYWPSSPYGGDDPNSPDEGDRHHWDVPLNLNDPEDRVDFRRWADETGKFISEYGMLAPPVQDSLQRFLAPGQQYVGSPGWEFHNNRFEMGNLETCLRLYWREPESCSRAEYLRATQIIQAEALKYSLEHFRHRKFSTSGALFWMFSDAWGAVGWSIIDYYLNKKPAYYYVRRALAPILGSFHLEDDGLALWLTNGTRSPQKCRVEYAMLDPAEPGDRITWHGIEAVVSANAAEKLTHVPSPSSSGPERGRYLPILRVWCDGQVVSRNRWFPVGFNFRALELPAVEVHQRLEQESEREFVVHLEVDHFAWAVHLQAPRDVMVQDNDFDMLPGEHRKVRITGAPADVAELRAISMNEWLASGREASFQL